MRILVVEDYGPLRGPVVTALRDEGWTVDVAGDGNGALQAMEDQEHDLVILDLMIPGVDGLNVLQRTRATGNMVHIMVMTARDSVEDRVRALDAGADDYLVKPFENDELLARVRCGLRHNACANILNRIHIGKAAHQIDDSIGIHHRTLYAGGFADVRFHQLHLAQIAQRLDMVGTIGVAARNTQPRTLTKQRLRDVATQKSAATKNRYQFALHRCSVTPRKILRALCTTARQLSRPTCVWRWQQPHLIRRACGADVDNIT